MDEVAFQGSLLDADTEPEIDQSFGALTRIQLDESSWVDHQPGWVTGSDRLFEDLVATAPWKQRTRRMYDRVLDEPRLTAWWGDEATPYPVVDRMRSVLSDRYEIPFDSVGLNLYRDGRDSVAWHGDRIDKRIPEPVVAIVSVGEPRRFLLRPKGGGKSHVFHLGRGDLLVTGGACQRRWQHSVPKVAAAGPRISITFRHGLRPGSYLSAADIRDTR